MITPSIKPCTLRDACLDDGIAASELVRSLGLTNPQTPETIEAHWRRLWVENPALAGNSVRPPLGWVLEKDGRLAGFFCNVQRLYYFGERKVSVSVASQWGLDKAHRRKIHQLAGAYFKQDNADILMATTANKSAGRIFQHYGADRIPAPSYDQALYWIIDGGGFLGAALKRKSVSPLAASALSSFSRSLVRAAQTTGWGRPKGQDDKVVLIGVGDIDDGFDGLWRRKLAEADRLLACRSSGSLRWHFEGRESDKDYRILTHRQDGRLRGYAVVMREDIAEIGLKRLRIADLFVENDDEAVVDGLLSVAFQYGQEQGCYVLEWVGMPDSLRQIARKHRPQVRALPIWPLYYKVMNNGLATALGSQDAWYITPYDGDTTLA